MSRRLYPFRAYLIGLMLSLECGIWAHAAEIASAPAIDFLEQCTGVESPLAYQAGNIDTTTTAEFMAHASAFNRDGAHTIFSVPAATPAAPYKYAGIGPVAVMPLQRYRVRIAANRHPQAEDTGELLVCATFVRQSVTVGFESLTSFSPALHSTQVVEKEWCVPPDVDGLILWIGWVCNPRQTVSFTPKIILSELRLVPAGDLSGNSQTAVYGNKNLLSVFDFEALPLGAVPNSNALGIFTATEPVIIQAGTKCLRIVKRATDMPFPRFATATIPLLNCGVEFFCKVKGRGRVHPMLWWGLPDDSWAYHANQREFELTDQWQAISIWRACLNPDQRHAAGSIAIISKEADICVDDVRLRIVQPIAPTAGQSSSAPRALGQK